MLPAVEGKLTETSPELLIGTVTEPASMLFASAVENAGQLTVRLPVAGIPLAV
jgi:hypothetical protein